MKPNPICRGPIAPAWAMVWGMAALWLGMPGLLAGADSPAGPTNTAAATRPSKPAHALPASIEEVVKMSEGGVSTEVLLKFVEGSGVAYKPSGPDIVAMKQRGLADDVTVRMIDLGRQRRGAAAPGHGTIAAPAIVRTLATDGDIDPESYEFFWMHYAYPRILQDSYDRLSPYYRVRPGYHRGYPGHLTRSGVPYQTKGFPRQSFRNSPRRR